MVVLTISYGKRFCLKLYIHHVKIGLHFVNQARYSFFFPITTRYKLRSISINKFVLGIMFLITRYQKRLWLPQNLCRALPLHPECATPSHVANQGALIVRPRVQSRDLSKSNRTINQPDRGCFKPRLIRRLSKISKPPSTLPDVFTMRHYLRTSSV